jgi:hypothetical protein
MSFHLVVLLIAVILTKCTEDPLSSKYANLRGCWEWVQTHKYDSHYGLTVLTRENFVQRSGLSFASLGTYSYWISYGMGRGIQMGFFYDSLWTSGTYSISESNGLLYLRLVEAGEAWTIQNHGTTYHPPSTLSYRIDRLEADSLVLYYAFDDFESSGYVKTTYAKVR